MDLQHKVGRKQYKFDLNQVIQLIYETGGKAAVVAKQLGCCATTFYDWLNCDHPELLDELQKARTYMAQVRIDSAEHVKETLMDQLEERPDLASRNAEYVLRRNKAAKDRGWITDDKDDDKKDDKSEMSELRELVQSDAKK